MFEWWERFLASKKISVYHWAMFGPIWNGCENNERVWFFFLSTRPRWTIRFHRISDERSIESCNQQVDERFVYLVEQMHFNLFSLAMINVSKVASFKPNGANYIDEDTTISTEQVNGMIWKKWEIRETCFVFEELWSISATSNRQGDEEIYARGSHIIWTYPLRDIQCPSYMEFTTETIPKKVISLLDEEKIHLRSI